MRKNLQIPIYDVLANMNILTVNIMGCAVRTMPWCIKEVYSYGIPFEEAVSDHTPRYPYSRDTLLCLERELDFFF